MSFTGQPTLTELTALPSWDPRTGDTIQRRWRGTPVAVEAQRVVLRAAGIRYQVEAPEDGGFQVISGYYGAAETQPTNEAISDMWDLEGEDLELAIWEHWKWTAICSYADVDTKAEYVAKVRAWIEALARGERTWTDDDGTTLVLSQAEIIDNATVLLNLTGHTDELAWLKLLIQDFQSGVEAFPQSRWVLRRTMTVAEGTVIRLDLTNIGRVFTTAVLIADNSIDPDIQADLPTGYWVKRTPKKLNVGSGKYTLQYEWWFAEEYSHFVYDTAT